MDNIYGGNGVGLFAQEYGVNSDNAVVIDRLYYSFPVGDEFTVVGGPVVRMDNMLPVWPSAYPSDMTMDFFTYAGAPGAYNLALGGWCWYLLANRRWFQRFHQLLVCQRQSERPKYAWLVIGTDAAGYQCHHPDCVCT